MERIESLFQKFDQKKDHSSQSLLLENFILFGSDAYIDRELKSLLGSKGNFEVKNTQIKKGGPDATLLDLGAGMSLFSSQTCLWIEDSPAPSSWKSEAREIWNRLLSLTKSGELLIVLKVPADKRVAWASLGIEKIFNVEMNDQIKKKWLDRINKNKSPSLTSDRLEYLSGFEGELLDFDNWIELWSLGGDAWASKAIMWNPDASTQGKAVMRAMNESPQNENPAYAWVDAVLHGDEKNAQIKLYELEEKGQEPLLLLGLLSKSVRILAQIESDMVPQKEAPFMIQKLKRTHALLRAKGYFRRGKDLLKNCAEVDIRIKTTATPEFTLLATLSAS